MSIKSAPSGWTQIRIAIPTESVEPASALLLAIGCHGVAEIGNNPGVLTGYLPNADDVESRIVQLRSGLDAFPDYDLAAPISVDVSPVDEKDWANEWKQYFKPLLFGDLLRVRPSWEPPGPSDIPEIVLDPGQAFGTGTHATTSLCLTVLTEIVTPGMHVVDIGCGSGILSLAAARLGATRVDASDIDLLPRSVTIENAERNGLGQIIHVHTPDSLFEAVESCDLVVANILAGTIVEITPLVRRLLLPGGLFVSSGIIDERVGDVLSALVENGFSVVEIRESDCWRAIVARRESETIR